MTGLETAFYIVGITFMGLMLIIGAVAAIALLVIRRKIMAIHDHIEDKLATANEWTEKGEAVIGAIKKVAQKTKR